MTHICVIKIIIGSDNGLSPGRHQAIIWTNVGILVIRPLGIDFSEILIKINTFSFEEMHVKLVCKMAYLFLLEFNELINSIFPFLPCSPWWLGSTHIDVSHLHLGASHLDDGWSQQRQRGASVSAAVPRDNTRVTCPRVCEWLQAETQILTPRICMVLTVSFLSTLWTLNVRGPSYLGWTRSISWLLIPWRHKEQAWYWLCRTGRPLSYLRKDFNYLCFINVEEWHKMQIYVFVPSEKFSM